MEIVIMTENPTFQQLIPGSKIASNTIQTIIDMAENQLFLNHHPSICFYFIKGNLSYQSQIPIRVSKQLLQRSDGGPISLSVNDSMQINLDGNTDLAQKFSQIQCQIQKPSYLSNQKLFTNSSEGMKCSGIQNYGNSITKYCFKCWQIKIQLVFAEMMTRLSNFKKIASMPLTNYQNDEIESYQHHIKKVDKIFIGLNQNNYSMFLNWVDISIQNDGEIQFISPQLSEEYISLKQEIQNQKNSFYSKIKIVKSIIGQDISIEKLLSEDETSKEDNKQYKRIKQIFETIKNIDNVIIEQESQIKYLHNQVKQKKKKKNQSQTQYARQGNKIIKQMMKLRQQIQNLQYCIKQVSSNKNKYTINRSFETPQNIKNSGLSSKIVQLKQIQRLKGRNFSTEDLNYIPKKQYNLNRNDEVVLGKKSAISQQKKRQKQNLHTKFISKTQSIQNQSKQKDLKAVFTIKDDQSGQLNNLLFQMNNYYDHINTLSKLIGQKTFNKKIYSPKMYEKSLLSSFEQISLKNKQNKEFPVNTILLQKQNRTKQSDNSLKFNNIQNRYRKTSVKKKSGINKSIIFTKMLK